MKLIDTAEIDDVITSLNKAARVQQAIVGTSKSGQDLDTIPGTNKPTLLKPGAEKILMMSGLTSEYEIIESVEDWSKGVFAYIVRCTLSKDGRKAIEGLGSRNSKEDKYRYRRIYANDVPVGINPSTLKTSQYGRFRIENEEIYSQVNTILKMAKKRAQVDVTLTVASLFEVFTQDTEDIKNFNQKEQPDNMFKEDASKFRLTFGKYKGQPLGDILPKDESYVDWPAINARDTILKQGAAMPLNNEFKTDENNVDNMEEVSPNGFLDEESLFMTDDVPFA